MKTLYLDLSSGISGDMMLGALLDLGVPLATVQHALSQLPIHASEFHIHATPQRRGGIAGTKFDVHAHDATTHPHDHDHSHPHDAAAGHTHSSPEPHSHGRSMADIREMIQSSSLSSWIQRQSIRVFERIARAEGKIHGAPPDNVHFHEVGAIDSIVDIVGTCAALEALGRPAVLASTPVEGTGSVRCAHGTLPLPAPATAEILAERGFPITQCPEPHELITPTGAALLAEFASSITPLHTFTTEKIGYGLGSRENHTRPNVLRALLGTPSEDTSASDLEFDTIAALETNLDDTSPEILGHFLTQAMQAGALDVFYTPAVMKKNRPGLLLTLLCPTSKSEFFSRLILTETSAFGVRKHLCARTKLRREITTAPTPFGNVEVKIGWLDARVVQWAPEFESCRKVAQDAGVPVQSVIAAAAASRPAR